MPTDGRATIMVLFKPCLHTVRLELECLHVCLLGQRVVDLLKMRTPHL